MKGGKEGGSRGHCVSLIVVTLVRHSIAVECVASASSPVQPCSEHLGEDIVILSGCQLSKCGYRHANHLHGREGEREGDFEYETEGAKDGG